jgi:hypothetical protein
MTFPALEAIADNTKLVLIVDDAVKSLYGYTRHIVNEKATCDRIARAYRKRYGSYLTGDMRAALEEMVALSADHYDHDN